MNPYETPDSHLEESIDVPKSMYLVYLLISLSFIIFLVEEIIFIFLEYETIPGIEDFLFIPIWAGILYWFTSSIRMRRSNPKTTFLILAVIVSVMSIIDPLGPYSTYTGLAESGCFLAVYYILRNNEYDRWFERSV